MELLLLAVRLLLALVFGVAGVAKLFDLRGSRQALVGFGVPWYLVPTLAFAIPASELAAAAVLPFGLTAWWGALLGLVLLVVFVAGIAWNLAQGKRPDCHCFGQLHSKPIGGWTLARNGALALMALLVVAQGPAGAGPGVIGWAAGLSALQAVAAIAGSSIVLQSALFGWLGYHMLKQNGRILKRLEDLEARLAPRQAPSNVPVGLPLGAEAPAFRLKTSTGEEMGLAELRKAGKPTVLIFSDPDCGPCKALMPTVGRWQRRHDAAATIAVVSRGTPESYRGKTGKWKLRRLLLQDKLEVAEAYRISATPGAVVVSPDGKVASHLAVGPEAISKLIDVVTTNPAGLETFLPHGPLPQVPPPPPPAIPVGQPAARVELPDLEGQPFKLADALGRKVLLLFWNPRCGFCQRMVDDLKAWEAGPGLRDDAPQLVLISAGPAENDRALGLRSTILIDSSFTTPRAFGGSGTPSAVLIDAEGRVASGLEVGAPGVLKLAGASPHPAALAAGVS